MATNNPYAPPEAAVADVGFGPQATQPVKVFSSKGRIGRLRYLCYLGVAYLVMMTIMFFTIGAAVAAGPSMGITAIVMVFVSIASLWVFLLWGIQRSHDIGWSGWAAIGTLIPFVGLLWFFMPGTPGSNAYGAPPPPNGTGVVLGALLFPLMFVLGMVAAISVPAYQDYLKRAGTVQTR